MSHTSSARELAKIVEFGECEADADLFRFAPAELGCRVEQIGSALLLLCKGLDIILFNRVIGLGLREPATEEMIDMSVAIFQRAGIRNFAVQLSPVAQPAALPTWLENRGLVCQDTWAKMYRQPDTSIQIPSDLRIERCDRRHAEMVSMVAGTMLEMPERFRSWFAQGIGEPGWQHYLAFDGDQPVAVGALFMRNQIGWLGMGATLPSHRRRGAQGALMAQRIRDAARAGCSWVITEAGEDHPEHPNPSFHNMLRTGFTLAYRRPNYIFQSPSHNE